MSLPDPIDPLGIDVQLTPQGDLAVTPAGQLAIVTGPDNCVQALSLRIKSSPGDLPLHPDYGSQFNEGIVGHRADFEVLGGVAGAEVSRLLATDRRFIGAGKITLVPVEVNAGLGVQITVPLTLTTGTQIQVADLQQARVSEIVDPTSTDVAPVTVDPFAFTTIDQAELDTLGDIDEQQALLNDLT